MTKEITLNHICKIEGHAHLTLKIDNNKVKTCQLKAAEGARFFEALVINKKLQDVQEIVTRICGICSSAHSVAAIQALEEALGIKPTLTQQLIRESLMIGERIRSNTTHLYFLTLPDYFNKASALQLGPEHKQKINDALQLIQLGNKIIEVFGGREMHPFLAIKEKLPETNLNPLIQPLEDSKPTIIKTIELFSSLNYPNLIRETDYLSLSNPDKYATINGKIVTNSGLVQDDDYKKHLTENIKEYGTSKYVLQNKKPYMTGAMARINNNYNQLTEESKVFLNNLTLPLKNPFHNNICQAIELLHMTNRLIEIIETFQNTKQKITPFKIKKGQGVSAVEAPRGTLFHEYKINNQGKIERCNIITPTAQNLNMIEVDISTLVNNCLQQRKTKEEIIDEVEKLIRAYDPCFSCSTHFLKVNWL